MATLLTKKIKRQMMSKGLERGKNRDKNIIVTLIPGDMIEFRVKGTRTTYSTYLGHAFRLAQMLTIDSDYKKRMKEYHEKKKFRKGLRMPKRPMIPFNKIYFESTHS